jgi:hypothetical protein
VTREGILDASKVLENAARWRMRGEKMRMLAYEAHDSAVRAMMLGIAEDCDRRAECAEDEASQDATMFRSTVDRKGYS